MTLSNELIETLYPIIDNNLKEKIATPNEVSIETKKIIDSTSSFFLAHFNVRRNEEDYYEG